MCRFQPVSVLKLNGVCIKNKQCPNYKFKIRAHWVFAAAVFYAGGYFLPYLDFILLLLSFFLSKRFKRSLTLLLYFCKTSSIVFVKKLFLERSLEIKGMQYCLFYIKICFAPHGKHILKFCEIPHFTFFANKLEFKKKLF